MNRARSGDSHSECSGLLARDAYVWQDAACMAGVLTCCRMLHAGQWDGRTCCRMLHARQGAYMLQDPACRTGAYVLQDPACMTVAGSCMQEGGVRVAGCCMHGRGHTCCRVLQLNQGSITSRCGMLLYQLIASCIHRAVSKLSRLQRESLLSGTQFSPETNECFRDLHEDVPSPVTVNSSLSRSRFWHLSIYSFA